ncbi:putative mitochondrial ATP-dependent helicase irc3 [Golovinomyces cichoracearum]|uniref:Putative mitochondrial ATP-dependent helicase irc3 n=1 Tax=Golovinomyces cichoracearum TaxID=62708 RepID=A0A420IDN9_9PEZI|nr:putative mitochondrial ATP-dependent helicase irc3 [Golovinomyces cichoracearum]
MTRLSRLSRAWIRKIKLCPTQNILQKNFSSVSGMRQAMKLREYQKDCINAVISNVNQGHKRLGISLATGAGKTVVFTQLIGRIEPVDQRSQTLILAHRQELVEQAARQCSIAYPTKTIEIEMGPMHATGLADITVASIQSIISGSRISKFDPSQFKLILVDEAHHIVASSYAKTLDHFGLSTLQENSPVLVGVSATLSRSDGVRLGGAIDHIVYHKDYVELIDEKWLSGVVFTTVRSQADVSRVRRGVNGDFQAGDLSKVVNTDEINEITVRSWLQRCKDRKSTLAFCVDLLHVIGLTNTFRNHGIDARFITGTTSKSERSDRLDKFKAGEFPVLVNCGVFTEGTDIPNIDCVLLARPTRSRNLLIQMIGRGMRLHPKKKNCHIIDMVASFEKGIVTSPTLFGLDPQELLKEAGPEDMKRIKKEREKEEKLRESGGSPKMSANYNTTEIATPQKKKITFTDYESVHDLISDTSTEQYIRGISRHSWVCTGQDRYILTHVDGCYLSIFKLPGETMYTVKENSNNKLPGKRPIFNRPRIILTTESFRSAVEGADTYAAIKYNLRFIVTSEAWRSLNATPGQIDFLNRFRPADDQLSYDSITKGRAADMITKIKHGARGEFSKMEVERRKIDRETRRENAKIERETVVVGPVPKPKLKNNLTN